MHRQERLTLMFFERGAFGGLDLAQECTKFPDCCQEGRMILEWEMPSMYIS